MYWRTENLKLIFVKMGYYIKIALDNNSDSRSLLANNHIIGLWGPRVYLETFRVLELH